MASSNHQAIIAEPVNHIFTSRQCLFVRAVWLSPLVESRRHDAHVQKTLTVASEERENWCRRSVTFKVWLISGSCLRRGKRDSLPSFSPVARKTFDVVAQGMLLFIPLCNKSHMFLLF